MKMNIFENLDKICSTKSFWSTMIIFSMILFIISLSWLCHKRYTSTQFLDNITKDPKSSSILLVSFLGLYLNVVFNLLFKLNSKDLAELILTNCIFLTLIILDKFTLDQFNSISSLGLTVVYYICLTSFACIFVGTITVNTWHIIVSEPEKATIVFLKDWIIYPFAVISFSLLINIILLVLAIGLRKVKLSNLLCK